MNRFLLLGLLVLMLASCTLASCTKSQPPLPEPPPTVYKENAYELRLQTQKLPDGRTVFVLNRNTFVKGAETAHAIVASDTLPAIGIEQATYVNEDEEGNRELKAQTVAKQYDVLFKVDTLVQNRSNAIWDTASSHETSKH